MEVMPSEMVTEVMSVALMNTPPSILVTSTSMPCTPYSVPSMVTVAGMVMSPLAPTTLLSEATCVVEPSLEVTGLMV